MYLSVFNNKRLPWAYSQVEAGAAVGCVSRVPRRNVGHAEGSEVPWRLGASTPLTSKCHFLRALPRNGLWPRFSHWNRRMEASRMRLDHSHLLPDSGIGRWKRRRLSLFFLLDVPYRRVSQRQEVLTGVHQVTTGSVDTRGSTSNTLRPEFKSAGILPAGISSWKLVHDSTTLSGTSVPNLVEIRRLVDLISNFNLFDRDNVATFSQKNSVKFQMISTVLPVDLWVS